VRTLARISVAPVKGFRLAHPERVTLTPEGIVENRRFFLVDEQGARLRSSLTAWPVVVAAAYDAEAERLSMAFPDGTSVEASAVATGEELLCLAGGREVPVRVVPGPWDEPLARLAGHPVRLVRPDLVGATLTEPVTLVSQESVNRLAREAGWPVDARRFRMTF